MTDISNFQTLSDDVICRSLKAKTYIRQQFDSPFYNVANSLMTLNVPSLPSFWAPDKGFFQFEYEINYTSSNDCATGRIWMSQNAPHSNITNLRCISSNGSQIANIQSYNLVHKANALLTGSDANLNRVLLSNIADDATGYAAGDRKGPYIVNRTPIAGAATATAKINVCTSLGLVPIFNSPSLLDLSSMSSQTRSACQLQLQTGNLTDFITTSTSAGTITINSVIVKPVYYMCILDGTDALRQAVSRMIFSDMFLVPIESYLTNQTSVPQSTKNISLRAYADEESVAHQLYIHQTNAPFTDTFDKPNCFSNLSMVSLQSQVGGFYYPSFGPITRPFNGEDKKDAVQFANFVLDVKQDSDNSETGTMINSNSYNRTSGTDDYDYFAGYSYLNGCQAFYSGLNVRASGGVLDTNIKYEPVSGAKADGVLTIFTKYERIYVLSPSGLNYITKDQYLEKINAMSASQESLLNQLLNISA